MADYATDIITALGGKQVTPAAKSFLYAWQRKEGGATNNAAHFNWLNRTDKGFPKINDVGVVAYPNYQTGVQRTAELIRSGYPSIATALRTGSVNLKNPQQQADLNRWVSGKREPGVTAYVKSIAGFMGQNAGPVASSGGGMQAGPAATQAGSGPQQDNGMARTMAIINHFQQQRAGGEQSVLPLIGQLMQLRHQSPYDTSPTQPMMPDQAQTGEVITSHGWKGTHVTDNLDWNHGKKTAADIMAHAGTPVGAPEAGTIERIGSAQGGSSVYFKGVSGKTYWLGHIDNPLPVGTQVNVNQPIAVVSSDHPHPHLHIDVLGGQ